MPPERLCHLTREKPAARIMSANALGFGNLRIEFDEVLIGFGIAGHGAAERRDDAEREQLIDPVEPGHVDGGEFQAQEAAAGPQHAKGFLQREIDLRHVADAERDGVGVEAAIRKGQRLGIALDETNAVVEMLRGRAVAADLEHIDIDVADGGAKAGARRLRGAKSDIAGAAGDVEQRERRVVFGGLSVVTMMSFQARCRPADIRSFIRS